MDKYQLAMLNTQITATRAAIEYVLERAGREEARCRADLEQQVDLLGKQQRILKNHLQDSGLLD